MNRRLRRSRWSVSRRDRRSPWGSLNPPAGDDWEAFAADLMQLESRLQALRERFETVRACQQQQQELRQQLQEPDLSPATVQQIKTQLDDLEIQLESSLLDWRSLQEPFWQAVRFGGLGIIIGWVLHAIGRG